MLIFLIWKQKTRKGLAYYLHLNYSLFTILATKYTTRLPLIKIRIIFVLVLISNTKYEKNFNSAFIFAINAKKKKIS